MSRSIRRNTAVKIERHGCGNLHFLNRSSWEGTEGPMSTGKRMGQEEILKKASALVGRAESMVKRIRIQGACTGKISPELRGIAEEIEEVLNSGAAELSRQGHTIGKDGRQMDVYGALIMARADILSLNDGPQCIESC